MRVLLVEDEGAVAMLLEDMLVELGHQVVAVAAKLETAEPLVARGGFDLAVLDVNLGGRYSYGLAETLMSRGTPFLFVTGYGAAGLGPRWKDAPVLQKPFEQRQLGEMIARLTPPA